MADRIPFFPSTTQHARVGDDLSVAVAPLLHDIEKPGRYMGGELNEIVKTGEHRARVALCFGDVYEVAMSHTGLHVLYHVINMRPLFAAERCYAPWPDMEQRLRQTHTPLFSLENKRPLHTFDLVGFTLQYELSYPSVLNMLELGGIPVFAKDRTSDHPIVIAGGAGAYNPEPMAPFIDGFLIGEGEDAILEMTELVATARQEQWPRQRTLEALTKIEGMYVPAFLEFDFAHGGPIQAIRSTLPGYEKAVKRTVPDLDKAPFPAKQLVPNVQIVHDRIGIEVQRGCTKSCRFCQAGMIFRPTRQRSPETVLRLVDEAIAATGQDEVSFLSLSIGDYEPLQPLLQEFFNRYRDQQIGVSLPSLRTETLTQEVVNEIARGKKHSFTLAPEAGSDRMRRVINKGNTEENLLRAVETAVNAGWRQLKYYFMIGLPFETQDDRDAIVRLGMRSRDRAKQLGQQLNVTVSVSSFCPKPHTPFQWEPQIPEKEIRKQQDHIRDTLKRNGLAFRYHNAGMTWAEGIISRGDRRVSKVIHRAFELGCRLDAWDEFFNRARWQQATEEALAPQGLTWEFYHRRREPNEILPWDAVDSGTDKKFHWKELARAGKEAEVEDCAWGKCYACSACDFTKVMPRVYPKESLYVAERLERLPPPTSNDVRSVRVGFHKQGAAVYLSHLDLQNVMIRTIRRLGVAIAYTQGFHPKPRLAFSPALPLGMTSFAECVDLDLMGVIDPDQLLEQLASLSPPGITFTSAQLLDKGAPSAGNAFTSITYEAAVDHLPPGIIDPAPFHAASTWLMTQMHKEHERTFDLKQELEACVVQDGKLRITIYQHTNGTLKADDVARGLWGDQLGTQHKLHFVKIAAELGWPTPRAALDRPQPERVQFSGKGRARDQVRRDRQTSIDVLASAPFSE